MTVLRTSSAVVAGLLLSTALTPAFAQCDGGWAGTVKYRRTQGMQSGATETRLSGRGTETSSSTISYDYGAEVEVVPGAEPHTSSGRATVSARFQTRQTTSATDKWACPGERVQQVMAADTTYQSEVSANRGGVEAEVGVSVNDDGTYSVSVGVPGIEGSMTQSSSTTYRGQCARAENASNSSPPVPASMDGNSFATDAVYRVNPADPNRLSGSASRTMGGSSETLSWTLQRCGSKLRIIDLKFEDMAFPTWNAWQDIVEQKGTIDGNMVRVTAIVANDTRAAQTAKIRLRGTYKGDKWDGAKPDEDINEESVDVPPGGRREVRFQWDSSGYAWYDDGRPRLVQRLKVELDDGGKKVDELTRNLKVAPKPLVLVHGLWSNWQAWETWQNILTTSHSYDWKAFPVGEKPEHGRMNTGGSFMSTDSTNTVDQNAAELARYVTYAQKDRNAWHVDLVAHSMGGLISRRYIHKLMPPAYGDGRPQVAHLTMLGTPNMGSPCADVLDFAFDAAGSRVEAVRQLRQDAMAQFNAETTNRRGVTFSVLAGNTLPTMCKTVVWNDGVVPVPSAFWEVEDHAESRSVHTELTGAADFSAFVKPRLALGPNKQAPAVPTTRTSPPKPTVPGKTTAALPAGVPLRLAAGGPVAFLAAAFAGATPGDFTAARRVPANGEAEIAITVEAAANLGITFAAAGDVSATLVDAAGKVLGENLRGSTAAAQPFRSIYLAGPVPAGTLTLRLRNAAPAERQVVLSAWTNAR